MTKDNVYWSRCTDSHDAIIREHDLRVSFGDLLDFQILRAGITPVDGDLSSDPQSWIYHVDQDILPAWSDVEADEKRCRAALKEWIAAAVVKDGAFLELTGSMRAWAYGFSRVVARDLSSVVAFDSSQIATHHSSKATDFGSSQITAFDSSQITAYRSSKATIYDSSQIIAFGSSQIIAFGSSQVTAYGYSKVTANEDATVVSHGKNDVKLTGNAIEVCRAGTTPKCYNAAERGEQ